MERVKEMTQCDLNTIIQRHEKWLKGEPGGEIADLRNAVLRGADLSDANLRNAVLRGADVDYSSWPLWCGSLKGVKVDARIARQLAYHLCSVVCDDPEFTSARNQILPFANKFHRVDECGELEKIR